MKKNSGLRGTPTDLRPIGARALKSAIDTLRPWLSEARVLDLFAGQGRFGISALIEGAARVTFVEIDRARARDLETATSRWGDRRRVVAIPALKALEEALKAREGYDLVFADPPFPMWSADFERALFNAVAPCVGNEGIFLVKHPSRMLLSQRNLYLKVWKATPFGESRLSYFRYGKSIENHAGE